MCISGWLARHTRRTFVDEVQFISGVGTSPEGMSRRAKEVKVLTPMAWLELNQTSRLLELRSVHPGYTAAEVQANTYAALARTRIGVSI